jgi:hypothetical protein
MDVCCEVSNIKNGTITTNPSAVKTNVSCKVPSKPIGGYYVQIPQLGIIYAGKEVPVGSSLRFKCNGSSGSIVGKEIIICEQNGSWSDPVPKCLSWYCDK